MTKWKCRTARRFILAAGILNLLALGEPAYAGSLNANEQELMAIIRGTYTYKGVTYRVKAEYIRVAEDYLLQDDVDCTEEQKQKALDTMYSSIQQGIDEGYLEAVNPQETAPASEETAGEEARETSGAGGGSEAGEPALSAGNDYGANTGELPEEAPKETEPSLVLMALEAYAERFLDGPEEPSGGEEAPEGNEGDYEHPLEWGSCLIRAAGAVWGGSAAGMAGVCLYCAKEKLFHHRSRRKLDKNERKRGRPE